MSVLAATPLAAGLSGYDLAGIAFLGAVLGIGVIVGWLWDRKSK